MARHRHYKFPWRDGNRFDILVDSTAFLPRMLAAIESARQYILLEMYLVASGTVASRLIEALLEAAGRGVRVYLLLDDFGAQEFNAHDRARLHHRQIELVYYNPLPSRRLLYNLYRIVWQRMYHGLYRNHRKLLLIDGRLAFTGGAGITDEVDSPTAPGQRWRETMIAIRGPVVADWQQLFTETWDHYAPQPLAVPASDPAPLPAGTRGRVTVNEAGHRMGVQRSLVRHITRARHRVWFATAYFIPSWKVRRKLKRAARAGVDVRLLLPGPVTDHPGARYASHRYYGRLLRSGVRIHEYLPRFLHAKTVLCDDWLSIGSCNFDRWNLQWNLEANQEAHDTATASTLAAVFRDDFSHCIEYTAGTWQTQRRWYWRVLTWFWRGVELLSLRLRQRRRR
ncbi:MAG: phospholipase D-like domain-containing protein [Gammaproteobacteria bacterium]|jgi:phosphatidylserine/phosphatidylglycerophosphate/cardiolipin synthase-like enzyme